MATHVLVQGMPVYDSQGTYLGAVQHHDATHLTVGGRVYRIDRVVRVTAQGVVLETDAASVDMGTGAPANETRVPLARERARVDVESVETGEVLLRREVAVETRYVPVDVMRDEIFITRRDIPVRPLSAIEAATAFNVRSIRIPLHAEEVRVDREPVVTGEVVVHRDEHVERRELGVRLREEVVDIAAERAELGAENLTRPTAPLIVDTSG